MRRAGHRSLPERPYSGPSTRGQHMNGKLTTTTTAVQITEAETEVVLSLGAEFHYDPADPLAVTMVIESIHGPVRWTFARELILNGRFEPTGDGDVHVWPCLDIEGAAVVIIELESPAGSTLLQFPSRAVQEFVSASLAAVPEGTEQHDMDAWIEQLLVETDFATN
jgi:sporulation and cell division protein SsgA